jgi:hypothetical protein
VSTKFSSEVVLFEFFARHLWPFYRPFVRKHLTQRCARCILSRNYVAIDAEGICANCRTRELEPKDDARQADGENPGLSAELDALLAAYAGANRSGSYDALVLFSGGKDSVYLLHRLRTGYPKLRLLAALVDNGFMSPMALGNAEKVINRFSVDMVTIKPSIHVTAKMFAYALTHLNEEGGSGTVDRLDGYLTHDISKNLAARLGIPLIISGCSRTQVETIFGISSFEMPRELERRKATAYAKIQLSDVFGPDEMHYWWDGTAWPEERIPRFIFPYYAWAPEEHFILDEVVRLGLIERKQSSPLVTNNELIPVIGMVDMAQFGYSSFEPEFAKMVAEGKADRTFWLNVFEMLEYSAKTGRFISRTVDDTLGKLGLTREQVGIRS